MRLLRGLPVALVVAVVTAIAACDSMYGEAQAPDVVIPTRNDGGTDDAAVEAMTDAGVDAALASNCPSSRTPTCALDQCARRTLYTPTTTAYPFSIVTDTANVYWVEQVVGDAGTIAAYNGESLGRVLRVAKTGGPISELAAGYTQTRVLALDGPYVYWAQSTLIDTTLFRLRGDCTTPCGTPELVTTLPHASPSALVRGGPGILFVMTGDGDSYRVSLAVKAGESTGFEKIAVGVGPFPRMTATDDGAFLTSRSYPGVARVANGGNVTPLYVDAPDGGLVGLATDCSDLWTHGLESAPPMTMTRWPAMGPAIVGGTLPTQLYFDMKADASFVYLAAANAGGVYAYDKKNGTTIPLYAGNVFALAVDADGIYWGEHGGSGTLYMLVK